MPGRRQSSLRDTRPVLATLAQALGLPDTGDQPYAERLVSHLRQANRLVVLDNMEHVAEAAPELADILTACPAVSMLATSRMSAEHGVPVTPLTLPVASDLSDLRVLAEVPSVAFLLERGRAVAPGSELTEADAAAIAAVCTRLDGICKGEVSSQTRSRFADDVSAVRNSMNRRSGIATQNRQVAVAGVAAAWSW
jgi:predicted ATPase